MSTYAVIGGSLWGNRGAEAMVVTTIGRVRQADPDASFLLMSYFPARDRELVHDPAVRVVDATPAQTVVHLFFSLLTWVVSLVRLRLPDAMLPTTIRSLRRCRALFDVSGISFHDGRLAVVAYNLFCVWPALLLKVPVVRLSQAMGPFRNPLNRVPARWVTNRAFHTFARGRLSAEYLRGLGVTADNWSVAADVAFAYRPRDSLTSENGDKVAELSSRLAVIRADGTGIVALVPSSLVEGSMTNEDEYMKLLCTLVDVLHERGLHVLVLPNATREGVDARRNNDITVIQKLRASIMEAPEGIDLDAMSYVDFDLNTASIRSLLEPCILVITSRFHGMVAALALGVPTLVVGWSHKYEEVLEMFGCTEHAVDVSAADQRILPMLGHLLTDRKAIRQRILKELPQVVASAESQFDLLDRLPIP